MAIDTGRKLHWTQRIALVRHNLHAARRTGDFTFFKTFQAHALIEGIDYVATLNDMLGDDADTVLSTLDNLNAGIAYVHQDAFKSIYDGAKSTMFKAGNSLDSRKSLMRVDVSQQREMADHAIDKTANAAITLIEAQPPHAQDVIANAWIIGTTIIADAVKVCLDQMDAIELCMDDFIRLEYAWGSIQNSVDAAVSALRGIFSLMASGGDSSRSNSNDGSSGIGSLSSISSSASSTSADGSSRGRASSNASAAFGIIKRAFSHSHLLPLPPPPPKVLRADSVFGAVSSPLGLRQSVSAACPTRIPHLPDSVSHTQLTPIPPTPGAEEERVNPFDFGKAKSKSGEESGGYFQLGGKSGAEKDILQIESFDPLYSPEMDDFAGMAPLTLRRLSAAFASSPIVV
ncbi:hypothetical protein AOQ84DRAFT_332434 [Glonium stellatum]|uniref:Uncharacterized protein n=1 Tax=Glonium stellatum TaxID=574774 RepID=A0A8E2JXS4_9PEZI|nr:hypothetical protein AOQ84DRAFT_332434 [Glonium stellatum]